MFKEEAIYPVKTGLYLQIGMTANPGRAILEKHMILELRSKVCMAMMPLAVGTGYSTSELANWTHSCVVLKPYDMELRHTLYGVF